MRREEVATRSGRDTRRSPYLNGAGLGLRRELLAPLAAGDPASGGIGFLEIAPENWMHVGGRLGRQFRALTERFTFAAHGLSLSLGGPAPLDEAFLRDVGAFLDRHGIRDYSEHISWCADADGHLYDLLPIPFTEEAVEHVAGRIRRAQDLLGRRIAVENASSYVEPGAQMSELAFIRAVVERADCDLLLDVNNLFVNAVNHRGDAAAVMDGLPLERVRYLHIAGHYVEADDLRVDTHGTPVCDPVWTLLERAYAHLGPMPTLLERDFNIPPLATLDLELDRIRRAQAGANHAARP
ncbi:MAG TPA: DUF692 domain-containing protein [Nevskiaceae bacterium]|nr:DUF692 domain-containing protein [Nevskiaceae bacterium]